jgi:acetyl esterase/lipase
MFPSSGSRCPACHKAICSACICNEMSHPNFPTRRVTVCTKCYEEALLARDGQYFETVPGPVSNRMMLYVANMLSGSFYELSPGQPIKVKRDSFVVKNLPTAKAHTADGWQSEDLTIPIDDTVSIQIRWYHPAPFNPAQAMGGIVYMHGGGWTIGTVFQADQDTNYRAFCKAFNLMFFAVEYRLSPEHSSVEIPDDFP